MCRSVDLRMKNRNTFHVYFLFPKVVPFMRKCEKILYSRAGRRLKYGRCALHAGYLRLQTHAQNI